MRQTLLTTLLAILISKSLGAIYDRTGAVGYAKQFCLNADTSQWPFLDSDDCTNFASQVLFNGGFAMVTTGETQWIMQSAGNVIASPLCSSARNGNNPDFYCSLSYVTWWYYSTTWTIAADFHDYVIQSGKAILCDVTETQPGDLVQLQNSADGLHHTMIIVDTKDNEDPTVAFHSVNTCAMTVSEARSIDGSDTVYYLCIQNNTP
ncbi:putative amidase domain-containing protein [Russula compacta]|nr:putative amidase domain-containing protein [Russula compacta]